MEINVFNQPMVIGATQVKKYCPVLKEKYQNSRVIWIAEMMCRIAPRIVSASIPQFVVNCQ
jgi:hypothetical protein